MPRGRDDDPDADLFDDAPEDAKPTTEPPLGDELDLHTFQPREVADVVAEYVRACAEAGRTSVRVVHGKGTGALRRIVHAVLEAHPHVTSFKLAGERSGQWGATLVELSRDPRQRPA